MWFCLPLPVMLVSFEFIKLNIKAPFGFFLGNLCSLNTFVKSILEELAGCKKGSLHFNKIPNVLQAYSEICIFCLLKFFPSEAVNED